MRLPLFLIAALLMIGAVTGARAETPISACGTLIKTSGSYVVTKNLTIKKGQNPCIAVETNYVTIDLGGFTISCNGELGVDGVDDGQAVHDGVVVRGGTITGCDSGVFFRSNAVLVDGLLTIGNRNGVVLLGPGLGDSVIRSISNDSSGDAFANSTGITVDCPATLADNTALGNAFKNLFTEFDGCASLNNLAP